MLQIRIILTLTLLFSMNSALPGSTSEALSTQDYAEPSDAGAAIDPNG